MLPDGGADNDRGLDPALFQNVGAAIARLPAALADCPFGIESWEVGPRVLKGIWQTAQERLPPAALTELPASALLGGEPFDGEEFLVDFREGGPAVA
jgi:hypothetical protein